VIPKFFNAHHSPVGAFASFTFGMKGPNGGFGIELTGPAKQNIFVGYESAPSVFECLPFFDGESASGNLSDYGISNATDEIKLFHFKDEEVNRSLEACTDTWEAKDLKLEVFSPIWDSSSHPKIPAIFAQLTISNPTSKNRRFFFGFEQNHPQFGIRPIRVDGVGIQNGTEIAFATNDPDCQSGVGFAPGMVLSPRRPINNEQLLGNCGLIFGEIGPGETKTIPIVIGFFKDGVVTSGIDTSYAYLDQFKSISQVLSAGFGLFGEAVETASAFDQKIKNRNLSAERHFQLSHAIRSYYGATQHLREIETHRDLWVVNEGEYRMINTLDLTADMAFFELDQHPWTVKNVLEWYRDRYSYRDDIVRGGRVEEGGLTFTHDMGVSNQFSRPHYSSYERAGYDDCFSYMTAEELLNWLGVATVYSLKNDLQWAKENSRIFYDAFESLLRRDDPNPEDRHGFIRWDSSRCEGGAEITTYDSLDISLGQTRGSGYMAGKMYGICLILEQLFSALENRAYAKRAAGEANLCANSIISRANPIIPAVFEGDDSGSTIIPHIEGLFWPMSVGIAEKIDSKLKETLTKHLEAVLKPGICKFEDGGWKLSSTSDNSWLSKIYLCQVVAEQLLGFDPDKEADIAHVNWLTNEKSQFFAWSDQIVNGVAIGSKYYPRGVTAWMWR
jgi:xylan 1,4-beta-xylosidase